MKCEPHLDLWRLLWDKTRQEKTSTPGRFVAWFWSRILRGCRVCNIFAALLSGGLWFSNYEEGIRSSVFFPLAVEGHRFALSWRSGPQQLSWFVLARAGWDFCPASSSLVPVATPATASALRVPGLGNSCQPWDVGAPQLRGSVGENPHPGVSWGWGRHTATCHAVPGIQGKGSRK